MQPREDNCLRGERLMEGRASCGEGDGGRRADCKCLGDDPGT